jgi:hypothetical protein
MGYGKLKVDLTYSDNADYIPDQLPDIAADTFTASKTMTYKGLSLTDASQANAIDLVGFTTILYVLVVNTGSTYPLYVTWASVDASGGAIADQDQKVPATQMFLLPGVTIASDLILDCAAGETTTADVIIVGT